MTPAAFPFPPELRLCAAALAGNRDALRELAARADLEPLIAANRIGPGLAIRAAEHGIEGPQVATWNELMRGAAATRLQLEAVLNILAETLSREGIPWAPIKGMGLDRRIYPHPEERISTDLDVLVRLEHGHTATDAVASLGWTDLADTRRRRRYVETEGYAWQVRAPGDVLLEIHFRLWGGVPEELSSKLLLRAEPAPQHGGTALGLTLPDSFLVAATHAWQVSPPRYLLLWWDLHRMATAMRDDDVRQVVDRSLEDGLGLFVMLSAATAADLWGHEINHRIVDALARHLRLPERWASSRLQRSSPVTASLGLLTLGRLLSGRPSRSGWRAVPRQIWAHPGTVDAETPTDWSWPKRRLTHLARKLHLIKA